LFLNSVEYSTYLVRDRPIPRFEFPPDGRLRPDLIFSDFLELPYGEKDFSDGSPSLLGNLLLNVEIYI